MNLKFEAKIGSDLLLLFQSVDFYIPNKSWTRKRDFGKIWQNQRDFNQIKDQETYSAGVDKLNIQIRPVKCLHKHYFKRSLLSTYALYVSCQIIFGNLPIFIDFFVKNQYEYNLWRHNETQKRKIFNKMAYFLSSHCISYNLLWYWSINPNLKFTLKKVAISGPYRTYSFQVHLTKVFGHFLNT